MKLLRIAALLGLGLGVSACGSVDVPTRNAPFEQLPSTVVEAPAGYQQQDSVDNMPPADTVARALVQDPESIGVDSPVTVNSVIVSVPRSLKVSERNAYLPGGDIVWREDPIGDRHKQVQTIVQDAIVQGVSPLSGPVKVDVQVMVTRFHALTEKARYTTGGVHSIKFELAITDPSTGELMLPIRTVKADLDAFGGQQALQAEARGLTQKVRITNHLAEVIRQELTNPEGYKNANLGFFQLLNNI